MCKHRVDAERTVDKLCDAEVDDKARQRKRVTTLEIVLSPHEVEHCIGRDRSRLVEILVEAERQPGCRGPGDRGRQGQIVTDGQRELGPLDGALDRELRNLTIALTGVTVPEENNAPSTGIGR